jgi:hypothetical protein
MRPALPALARQAVAALVVVLTCWLVPRVVEAARRIGW